MVRHLARHPERTGPVTVAEISFTPLSGAHWLHPQKTSRIPRRYVFFDTEAYRDISAKGESQRWRLGVTCCVKWREVSQTWSPIETVRHGTPAGLAETITGFGRKDARTIAVAHNLAYDIRIAGLLAWLVDQGWVVSRPTFTAEHVSFEASKGGRKVVFVDSLSLVPISLAKVGGLLGVPKPPLPGGDETDDVWYARCEADVRITATAYMAVIERLRSEDLGGWARSGASIGWHTLLRRHLTDKVLVHGRPEVREAEGAAMYAGRCEVWRHGFQAPGPFYEWDFKTAYGRICAETALPATFSYEVRGIDVFRLPEFLGHTNHLCEATITTDVPILPFRDDGGVYWPVGRFQDWYWDVELLAAQEAGATVQVHRAYRYRSAPWMASWATWCLSLVDDDSTPEARVMGAVAKHWQRAVPGRSAMKYRAWEEQGDAYVPGVSYMPMLDLDNGSRGACLTLGGQRWEAWRQEWWGEALPQLLSYVMACARVRLWEAMQVAGLEEVLYVDTDCLIVAGIGHERLDRAVRAGCLGSLRYKRSHQLLELTAPQLVEGSTYRRLSGVPRGARRTAQSAYDGEVWEGLTTALAEGHPDEVRIRNVSFDIHGIDTRRLHLPGGATAPFTVSDGRRSPSIEKAS
jgi:hypothetical protein